MRRERGWVSSDIRHTQKTEIPGWSLYEDATILDRVYVLELDVNVLKRYKALLKINGCV